MYSNLLNVHIILNIPFYRFSKDYMLNGIIIITVDVVIEKRVLENIYRKFHMFLIFPIYSVYLFWINIKNKIDITMYN